MFTLIVGLVIYKRSAKWVNVFGLLIGLVGAIGLIWKGGTDILKGINLYALFIVVATICYGINVNEIKYKLSKLSSVQIRSSCEDYRAINIMTGDYICTHR